MGNEYACEGVNLPFQLPCKFVCLLQSQNSASEHGY